MKAFLAFALTALLGLASSTVWLYLTQYQPLAQSAAVLAAKNDLLTSDLNESKNQMDSLQVQISVLSKQKEAEELKVSDLIEQLNQLKSSISAPAVIAKNSPEEFVAPSPIPAQPNWTWTVSGKDYHNVAITKIDADTVSITYDGGLGTINTSDLTLDIQKLLNYDPDAAKAANQQKALARAKADADFQRSFLNYSSQSATEKVASLRIEQQKLLQLKNAMDRAQGAVVRATTHTNAFGVAVYNDGSHDRDGGIERHASIEALQTAYDSAKDAYETELRIVLDSQK